MPKLTLSDLSNITGNEQSAITTINNNNTAIETALENTLSRDGTSPNSMGADLDMNSNDVMNVATLEATSITATTVESGNFTQGGISLTAILIDWEGPWVVSTAYAVGDVVQNTGSAFICVVAHTSSLTTEPGIGVDYDTVWDLLVLGGQSGDIDGPVTTTDNALARWDGTTGTAIQNSTLLVDDTGNIVGVVSLSNTGAGGTLRISSTDNATKGTINLGNATTGIFFNETNERLSLGADDQNITIGGTSSGIDFSIHNDEAGEVCQTVFRYAANAARSACWFGARARGNIGSENVVQSGDRLVTIQALGFDGTDYEPAAQILVEVDGTPGSNDMPGRLLFLVTPDGSAVPIEAFRISQDQTARFASTIDLGGATDATIARAGAGDISVEGNVVYRAGGTDVPVTDGGTGLSAATAYAVLCGGTTGTNPLQYIASVGTVGQVLTSQGAGALPTFETPGSGLTEIALQVFTASGTYTPTSGMAYCFVISTGGGGGGGGADSTDGSSAVGAGGGGAGATCMETFSASTIGASQTVTIGAAGAAGANTGGNGGNGGNTTFGALHTAGGGTGGTGLASGGINNVVAGGAGGTASGGAVNISGQSGGAGIAVSNAASIALGGLGGSSYWGGGGASVAVMGSSSNGATAVGYGGGGSGAVNCDNTAGNTGGAGLAGVVFVLEFIT